jgi:ABC-type lipoprotein release transport system permease subunit
MARLRIILLMAWRNLFSYKGKNAIVGLIMIFGTFLVVMGTSLLDSIDHSMARSITASIAGHLQVYDADAEDDLALFGGGFMGAADIGSIPDFSRVKEVLSKVPNVKAVVPMGINAAEFYTTTELDRAIESYRQALMKKAPTGLAETSNKIRSMAGLMEGEFIRRKEITSNVEEVDRQLADIRRVKQDEFWEQAQKNPDQAIEFLDTRLAPLVDENEGYFMRYLGTDIHLFAEHFDTFEMVKGEMIPQGRRGLLVNQKFYDDVIRNRVAREFDDLKEELELKHRKIKKDPLLQNQVARMVRQYRRITFQLEPDEAADISKKLKKLMPEAQGNIDELVQQFLEVDDQNFAARYRFFFDEIAPRIQLYLFDIGDVITIRTYTQSGYVKSVNVKVYGTFRFKGLETSDLAGSHNLIDILTFRDLYGMMTKEKHKELKEIQAQVGLKDIEAADAEEALFGGGRDVEKQADSEGFDEFEGVNLKLKKENGKAVHDTTYDQRAIDEGVALNAAVVLEDPDRLEETRTAVEQAIADNKLGLQVVDWQTASGIVGQLVILVRVVLYVAIFIIFLVALVIINNTMIMATMERTIEIGTMRAIGGQTRFVLSLFLLETILLGAVAGIIGTLLGAGLVNHLNQTGIPAMHDIMVFLFSGPLLYPTVGTGNLIAAWVVILLVSLAATFYPAYMATRIQPVVAMQARE